MMTNNTVQRTFHAIKARTAFTLHRYSEGWHPQGSSWHLTFILTFDSIIQLPVTLHFPCGAHRHICLGSEDVQCTATATSKACTQ